MADVSHELGALRFVVDSPLSSKVAMFNNQAQAHKNNQLLNPFSNDGRVSPKPQFSKDEYGKPLAGSLTEMRGQKANIHVMKEMLELCQIINSEGYDVKDEPEMRVIPFGELFNIYNYISDKVVGILLRARKHKLVEFEGEMLFQRRDDDVPIFLLKPIAEIRQQLEEKMEECKRASSPAPQATSVLLDQRAHEQKLKELQDGKLGLPQKRSSKSRSPSPATSRAATPVKGTATPIKSKSPSPAPAPSPTPTPTILVEKEQDNEIKKETSMEAAAENQTSVETTTTVTAETATISSAPKTEQITQETAEAANDVTESSVATPEITVDAPPPTATDEATEPQVIEPVIAQTQVSTNSETTAETKIDVNNNNNNDTATAATTSEEPPTVVIEATAVYERKVTPAVTLNEDKNTTEESDITTVSNPAENVTV